MIKLLKAPETLYAIGMWIISLLFASFLLGLGGNIIRDLPKVENQIQLEQYADVGKLSQDRVMLTEAQREVAELRARRDAAEAEFKRRDNAYNSEQQSHSAWLANRSVRSSNPQAAQSDPEIVRRTELLDAALAQRRAAQIDLEAADEALRLNALKIAEARSRLDEQMKRATPQYHREYQMQELRVFLVRLGFTLPLLLIACWLIWKKRGSSHWPLARGFVIAAFWTFFVELVPYLPSWGGYARSIVGILVCVLGGNRLVRWMQGYIARRREEAARSEEERRRAIDCDFAFSKMSNGLCPGCERPILALKDTEVNNCVHCGLTLFDRCVGEVEANTGTPRVCGTRKNAYFRHCPSCGTVAHSKAPMAAGPAIRELDSNVPLAAPESAV